MWIRHGHAIRGKMSPEYRAWRHAYQRCHNKNDKGYPDWGGRGITMHQKWRRNFAAFFAHIGKKPTPQHSLDRIDNSRGYVPGNVRWATRTEQARNKRNNLMITALGRAAPLAQWAEWMRLPASRIQQRIVKLKWEPEKALGLI